MFVFGFCEFSIWLLLRVWWGWCGVGMFFLFCFSFSVRDVECVSSRRALLLQKYSCGPLALQNNESRTKDMLTSEVNEKLYLFFIF